MESPPSQEKGTPPSSPGSVAEVQKEARKVVKKQIREAAKRMNFWVPASLYSRLEEEAEKEGMTMSAWVQVVLLKRPERVIEKTLLPRGTADRLALIPTLEKQVASLTKDRAAVAAERDALKATLAALRKRIGTGIFTVKCPSCREKVGLDLTEEMGLKHPDKPKG